MSSTPGAEERPPGLARVVLPYLVLLLLALTNWLTGPDDPLAGTYGVATLVAAVVGGPRSTAVAGAVVLVVATVTSTWEDTSPAAAVVGLCIVAACSVGAVLLASYERRQQTDYAQVRAVADAVQQALLRPVAASVAGVEVAARYVSAARLAQVGGDFYEVVPWDGGARLVVGDVKGKGLDAVGTTAVALGVFREAAASEASIEAVAARADQRLRQYLGDEDFVTAMFAELRTGPGGPFLRLVSCGHPAPLLVRRGQVDLVRMVSRPPLGLGEPAWSAEDADGAVEVVLGAGEGLLLYTDGLIEARDAQRSFVPLEDLTTALSGTHGEPPGVALDRLLAALRASTDGALGDDLALLLVQRPPARAVPPVDLPAAGGLLPPATRGR